MKPQYTDDDLAVALQGIYRSRNIFFRIDPATGSHLRLNVSEQLEPLGIGHYAITRILQSYPFPELKYHSDNMIAEEAAKNKPKERRSRQYLEEDEQQLTDEEKEEEIRQSKRYSLTVQNNGYYGAYDQQEATQALFKTEEEAIAHIHRLLHGGEAFSSCYAKVNFHRREVD